MDCRVRFLREKCADAEYCISAPGYKTVSIYWADERGALEDWTALACLPVSDLGDVTFLYSGGRAVPPEATHIWVTAEAAEPFHQENLLVEIPEEQKISSIHKGVTFCAMSDLHLSSKSGVLRQAFSKARHADALLLAGDMTNDGLSTQFAKLRDCIEAVDLQTPIFSVRGNHDIPRENSQTAEQSDTKNYMEFQNWLQERLKYMDHWQDGPDGAYAVCMNDIEIIGLQAVTDKRQFLFKEGKQLQWLDQHLSKTEHLSWRLILCHAPLLHHNPKREVGKKNPYLHKDKELQAIVNSHKNLIFVSGHTHLSMNHLYGCVEWDMDHNNLYINDASIRPTDIYLKEYIVPDEWRDGTCLYITISDGEIEILTQSIKSNKKHARGYYRIKRTGGVIWSLL